jgi:hypothetical protein
MKFRMNNSKSFFNVILVLGLIILIVVIYNYNSKKITKDNMYNSVTGKDVSGSVIGSGLGSGSGSVIPGNIGGMDPNENFLNVSGLNTNGSAGSCNQKTTDPSDLLPKDMNSDWSNVNPANADLKNINLLSAGQLIGINTVGSSLRNPSLQERSEPVIPKTNIGPWNNSTIDADTYRRPLEIGTSNL